MRFGERLQDEALHSFSLHRLLVRSCHMGDGAKIRFRRAAAEGLVVAKLAVDVRQDLVTRGRVEVQRWLCSLRQRKGLRQGLRESPKFVIRPTLSNDEKRLPYPVKIFPHG